MPAPAPDHPRADLQHLTDRNAQSRPNTSYLGSCVDGCDRGLNSWIKIVVGLVLAIIVWQVVKFLLQR